MSGAYGGVVKTPPSVVNIVDLKAFAEACVYTRDWENGRGTFMIGWLFGRYGEENAFYAHEELLAMARYHSTRYRKHQGQLSGNSVDRKSLARWAKRFLEDER